MFGKLLIVVAHPDDEIIGAGNYLASLTGPERREVVIVYATGGVPRNPRWAHEAGFETCGEYFAARRRERDAALEIAGVDPRLCRDLGLSDQEVAFHLSCLTKAVSNFIDELRPDAVLTHPYEGGHPDHDACALACQQAIEPHRNARPRLKEFACYHGGPNGFTVQEFLPSPGTPVSVFPLNTEERLRKQQMFDCHRTQERVLRPFSTECEKFRNAPSYNFLEAPHAGPLHYETLGWDMTGPVWREQAREVLDQLGKIRA